MLTSPRWRTKLSVWRRAPTASAAAAHFKLIVRILLIQQCALDQEARQVPNSTASEHDTLRFVEVLDSINTNRDIRGTACQLDIASSVTHNVKPPRRRSPPRTSPLVFHFRNMVAAFEHLELLRRESQSQSVFIHLKGAFF
jgi:hypothetical protein